MDTERWWFERSFVMVPAQVVVRDFLQTFIQFPPRQEPASFSIDKVLKQMEAAQKAQGR